MLVLLVLVKIMASALTSFIRSQHLYVRAIQDTLADNVNQVSHRKNHLVLASHDSTCSLLPLNIFAISLPLFLMYIKQRRIYSRIITPNYIK